MANNIFRSTFGFVRHSLNFISNFLNCYNFPVFITKIKLELLMY
jgi:hypothetical protein